MDFVVDFGKKSPELDPKNQPAAPPLRPGFLADFAAKSPELLRPRLRVKGSGAYVCDFLKVSPELADSPESLDAVAMGKDLQGQQQAEAAAVGEPDAEAEAAALDDVGEGATDDA